MVVGASGKLASDTGDIDVRLATGLDRGSIAALWADVFQKSRPESVWCHGYERSPAGPAISAVAVVDGQVVAHAGLLLQRFVFQRHPLVGAQSVDAMTHRQWRRQGLNRRLWEVLEGEITRRNIGFVYGFSNENSTVGAQSYQNRQPIRPFPLWIRPIVSMTAVAAAFRGDAWEDLAQPPTIPEEVADIGPDFRGTGRLVVNRDKAYWEWRYQKPGGRYRLEVITENGLPTAVGAVTFRKQWGLRTAFLMDTAALSVEGYQRVVERLIHQGANAGAVVMTTLVIPGTVESQVLKRLGFFAVPETLNPETIMLSIRLLPPALDVGVVMDPQRLQFSWAEHDVV